MINLAADNKLNFNRMMIITRLAYFFILAFLLFGCTKSDDDGPGRNACDSLSYRLNPEFRIVEGTSCDFRASPVVEITLLTEDGDIGLCSGSIIAPEYILTAAHCYIPSSSGEIKTSTVSIQGFDFAVEQVFIHPEANLPQNDIAIVKLEKASEVASLPLLVSEATAPEQIISIFGYGFDEENNFANLKSGEMRITGVTSQNVYARFQNSGSNICFGDSGGPALRDSSDGRIGIIGVTSFATTEGCSEDSFAAFANIQGNSILDFILEIVPEVEVF